MGGDLAFDMCDPTAPVAPPGWAAAIRHAGLHPVWDWSVVRTAWSDTRSRVLAGVFCDGGQAVGVATARVYGLGRRLTGMVDVECVGTTTLPGIGLSGGVPGTLHPSGPAPELLAAAVGAFESAIRREYGRWRPLVAYRQVYAGELPVVLRGATVVRAGAPVAVLYNRFDDHDGYLRSLAKSRRVDQRRLRRRIDADPALTVRLGPAEPDLDVTALHRINTDTARRNHHTRWPRLTLWPRGVFAALVALPGVEVLSYTTDDGGLVAASLFYDHPVAPVVGAWGARALGPDRRTGLWFDHLDRLIRRTIDAGRAALIGGKGHAELKAALGFAPTPQWTVVRILN